MTSLAFLCLLLAQTVPGTAQEATISPPAVEGNAPGPVRPPAPIELRQAISGRIVRAGTPPPEPVAVPIKDSQTQFRPLRANYRIEVHHTVQGKADSLSVVTAAPSFAYDGFGTGGGGGDTHGIPSNIHFEGEISHESETGIFLRFSIQVIVPLVNGLQGGGAKGAPNHVTVSREARGIHNGATFSYGKPLKIVESDQESLAITIHRLDP